MRHEDSSEKRPEAGTTAASSIADALHEMIVTQLAPGASLPSEAELAARFEVSRLTVREAVKMLAGRGLLDLARGRRAIVREPDSSAFADFLSSIIRNDPKGLFDLIELRMTLETQSAALAARRSSRAGLQAIENAMAGMREAAALVAARKDVAAAELRFHAFDVQFHEAVATASGNRILAHVFEAMTKPLRESFNLSYRGQTLRGTGREETLAAHQAVLDAIRAGDQRAAAAAMREHLKNTELDIRSHLTSTRTSAGP